MATPNAPAVSRERKCIIVMFYGSDFDDTEEVKGERVLGVLDVRGYVTIACASEKERLFVSGMY